MHIKNAHGNNISEHNLQVYSTLGNEEVIFWASKIHTVPALQWFNLGFLAL